MSNLAYKLDESYTYADYLSWDDSERYEIIDGIVYAMASPAIRHQEISGELYGEIWGFLKGKPYRVFAAPFDVRLFPEAGKSDTTVIQPDILVVCDSSKLSDRRSCKGAPDMIVEVMVNILDNGLYISKVYNDLVPSSVLPGLIIDLNSIKEILL
jgi:Uma2 family endonuclease